MTLLAGAVTLTHYGDWRWTVTAPATVLPVTVDELKLFARIDWSSEDELLEAFISSATFLAEKWLNRALLQQTIKLVMDTWPEERKIELPRPPLISVSAVRQYDEDGVATAFASSNFYTITNADPGVLVLKESATVPYDARDYAGYEIEYLAGYGATASAVPQPIRDAVKLWAAEMHEARTLSDYGSGGALSQPPPPSAAALLRPYRKMVV